MTKSDITELQNYLEDLALIDNHCHSIIVDPLDRESFEDLLTEAPNRTAAITSTFDSSAGLSLLKICGTLLSLKAPVKAEEYLSRRSHYGARGVSETFMRASNTQLLMIDGGYKGSELIDNAELAAVSSSEVAPIVRLESLAESLLEGGMSPHGFPSAFRGALTEAAREAVGLKSVAAYRCGLGLLAEIPSDEEVVSAVRSLFDSSDHQQHLRISDPILESFLAHVALQVTKLPLQFHVGYGDPDLQLNLANPTLLTPFLRSSEAGEREVILLHCYPYHREAAYLSHVFPHVYFDLGLALNFVGPRASQIFSESMELAPFAKMLYSSDAFGLAELHYLGSRHFRDALFEWLRPLVETALLDLSGAKRICDLIGRENSERAYHL